VSCSLEVDDTSDDRPDDDADLLFLLWFGLLLFGAFGFGAAFGLALAGALRLPLVPLVLLRSALLLPLGAALGPAEEELGAVLRTAPERPPERRPDLIAFDEDDEDDELAAAGGAAAAAAAGAASKANKGTNGALSALSRKDETDAGATATVVGDTLDCALSRRPPRAPPPRRPREEDESPRLLPPRPPLRAPRRAD